MHRLLLAATVAVVALAAAASAAPDAVRCTEQLARDVVRYDGPLDSYPDFATQEAGDYADCVA